MNLSARQRFSLHCGAESRTVSGQLKDNTVISIITGLIAGGVHVWSGPDHLQPGPDAPRAFLLPVFDEQYLSYPSINFPRAAGHPRGDRPHSFAEAGGGVVVCDRHDVGWWKRKEVAGGRVVVTMGLATSLGTEERALIVESAARLGPFRGRAVDIVQA